MTVTTYLIQMADRSQYREEGKLGHKISDMSCYVKSMPVYAMASKAKAVAECRKLNHKDTSCMIHYPEKIDIY